MDEFSLRKLATVYTTDIRVRFHATFAPTLPMLSAAAKAQMRVKRVLGGHAAGVLIFPINIFSTFKM